MKVLYIPSGYVGIYQSFEKSIMKAFSETAHEINSISISDEEKFIHDVRSFKPDVALTMVGFKMPYSIIAWLKKQGIKLAVWMTEDPFFIDQSMKIIHHFNYVFTIDHAALRIYKQLGHQQVYYLPLGTDPVIYHPIPSMEFKHDICLVGYPYPNRIQTIQFLLENTNYSIQVVGPKWIKKLLNLKIPSNLSVHSRWIHPKKTNIYYNRAKINLNTHRPYNLEQNENIRGVINQSINNRTFDIASSGSFQLIEYKPDLSLHFTDGKDIVSFTNNEELLEKVNYYIGHAKERNEVYEKTRENVLNNHTFQHRINEMIGIINTS